MGAWGREGVRAWGRGGVGAWGREGVRDRPVDGLQRVEGKHARLGVCVCVCE